MSLKIKTNNKVQKKNIEEKNLKGFFSIENLWVEYRTLEGVVYAVNGVSLSLSEGEVLGLVGETGAGKTTTVMSILKLLPKQAFITKGKIVFNQQEIFNLEEKKMKSIRGNQISMVFQDPMSSLDPVYPVLFQIAETVKVHQNVSWEKARKRAIEMLQSVGISSDRANEYPHEFSGGMIQRVMIAIALSCQPRLLIADEPTTALDVTIQAQVLELIKDLKEKFNTSMILITHDLGVVPEICDKVAVMYSGKIIEEGSLKEVYNKPLHPYTQGLFKCIPDIGQNNKRLEPIPGLAPSPKSLPSGCPFHPRCFKKIDICSAQIPHLLRVNDDEHYVACFLYRGNR